MPIVTQAGRLMQARRTSAGFPMFNILLILKTFLSSFRGRNFADGHGNVTFLIKP